MSKKPISTHPPREGRDRLVRGDDLYDAAFQPTRPVRGGTRRYTRRRDGLRHFNPPAP